MMSLNCLKAERLKMKNSVFTLLHVIMPLMCVIIFLVYYSFTAYAPEGKILGFFQTLSVAFILMISIVCSVNSSVERKSGNCFNLLTIPEGKTAGILGKSTYILAMGSAAVLAAVLGFGMGNIILLGNKAIGIGVYLAAGVSLIISNVFVYWLSLFLSLRFGFNAAIGSGIVGCLLAALLATGMGDGIWMFVPYAWGTRFVTLVLYKGMGAMPDSLPGIGITILFCLIISVVLMAAVTGWFKRWDGYCPQE